MIRHRRRAAPRRISLGAFALAVGLSAPPLAGARAGGIVLHETGSTLLYPLFEMWRRDYPGVAPGVSLTAAATGSGVGEQQAISGQVHIGASDAYLSDEQAEQNPTIKNIPLAISAQTVNYNLPGLNGVGLKLDGPTLAGIYMGEIRQWDTAPIKAMNPGVALPTHEIVPTRRADASGDTFVFTQFLDFSTQRWADKIGYGTTVDWPEGAALRSATGNQGMVEAAAATPFSLAYIGVSFREAVAKAGLGTAPLRNQNGKFLLPNAVTIAAGAAMLDRRTPSDQRLSLVFAAGDDSYPLINYEYAVVSIRQPDPETAAALRNFLLWAISPTGGNASKYLDRVGFIPLPNFIRGMSEHQIALIK
jgi:phosphate transport system substrate-binding protein